jgi:hypothetical protein
MSKLRDLKKNLKPGHVYRTAELAAWSNAVDRHAKALVNDGTLKKLKQGMYYYPKQSVFGAVPPDEEELVETFLKDDHFLLTSPNDYNSLGVGTTQLYNKRVVYNHKRHGDFKLGGRVFSFHVKPRFPSKVTEEFLLVDLVNHLERLAEDQNVVLQNVAKKVETMEPKKLKKALMEYGGARAKSFLTPLLQKQASHAH